MKHVSQTATEELIDPMSELINREVKVSNTFYNLNMANFSLMMALPHTLNHLAQKSWSFVIMPRSFQ